MENSSIGQHDSRSLGEDLVHAYIYQGAALQINRVELLSDIFLELVFLQRTLARTGNIVVGITKIDLSTDKEDLGCWYLSLDLRDPLD